MEFNKQVDFISGMVILGVNIDAYAEAGYTPFTVSNKTRWPLIDGSATIETTKGAMQEQAISATYSNVRLGILKLHSQVYEYMNVTGQIPNVPLAALIILTDFDFSIDAMIVYEILHRLCQYGCSMPRMIFNDETIRTHEQYMGKRDHILSTLPMDKVAMYYSMLLFTNIQIRDKLPPILESSLTRNRSGQIVAIDKRVLFLATFTMKERTLSWITAWDSMFKEIFPMIAFCLLVESYEPILILDETTHIYMNSGKYICPVEYELAMLSQYIATFGTLVLNQTSPGYLDFCRHHHIDERKFAQYLIRLIRALGMQLFTQYNNFNAKQFIRILIDKDILTGVQRYISVGNCEYENASGKIRITEIAQLAPPQYVLLIDIGCWISA